MSDFPALSWGRAPTSEIWDNEKKIIIFEKHFKRERRKSSLINQFVGLQYENPRKGDWVSSCLQNLEYLMIKLSFDEIKDMKRSQQMVVSS